MNQTFACRHKREHGRAFCNESCPMHADGAPFEYVRIERGAAVPPPDPRTLDVAILDMNHGWPNLGHNSMVQGVVEASCDLLESQPDLRVRVLSFDIRRGAPIPEAPTASGGRYAVYLGTGGPGHLDPRCNDGVSPESQGVKEDPSWEAPLFALYDAIAAREHAALLAVCHTFGVLCRWSQIADPHLRGAEKGGKSTGILENLLTPQAIAHPWFGELGSMLRQGRLRITDTRLFDLLPHNGFERRGVPIGYETIGIGGPAGDALTMFEFARDTAGTMPRVFAVNHHPEVVERSAQMAVLQRMERRGEVTEDWARERRRLMTEMLPDEDSDRMLRLTSDFTFLGPMRFHLYRAARRRVESLGLRPAVHEDMVLEAAFAPSGSAS